MSVKLPGGVTPAVSKHAQRVESTIPRIRSWQLQPHEKRKPKPQSGVARARLLLKKNLGWLPGYPVGIHKDMVVWQAVRWKGAGTTQAWQLGREDLRRAQMTLTKLRYHFPKALPKVVGAPDAWLQRMDVVLQFLKAAVHQGQDFVADSVLASDAVSRRWAQQAAVRRSAHPQLRALLDSVCFVEFTGRDELSLDVFEWLGSHADDLSRWQASDSESLLMQLTLCDLREVMPEALFRSLVTVLADPGMSRWKIETSVARIPRLRESLFQFINGNEPKPEQPATENSLGELLSALIREVASEKPKQQQQRLDLLALLFDKPTADDVYVLHAQIAAEERRLDRLLRQLRSDSAQLPRSAYEKYELRRKVLPEVDPLAEAAGDVLPIADRMSSLSYCLSHFDQVSESGLNSWPKFLREVPAVERGLRLGMVRCWLRREIQRSGTERMFDRTLNRMESLLHRRGLAPSLRDEWCREFRAGRADWMIGLCQACQDDKNIVDQTIKLLERVAYDDGTVLQYAALDSLGEFVAAEIDLDRAARVIAILSKSPEMFYDEQELRSAFLFGGPDDETVAGLLRQFDATAHHTIVEHVEALRSVADDFFLRETVARLVLADDAKRLEKMGAIARLFPALGEDLPVPRRLDVKLDWIAAYPAALHEELRDLAQVVPTAEAIARRVLNRELPPPEALQQEITAISGKLAGMDVAAPARQHLQQRLDNLTGRLQAPREISAGRLQTLGGKLRVRIEREVIEGFIAAMRARLADALRGRYQLPQLPEDLLEPPLDRVLVDLLRLSEPMRELGIRLVFETLSRSTRRFDDEPANIDFTQKMESQGVRMHAWLDESFHTTAKDASGAPYRLAFTRDVIDFLLMGFHFGTCLSPGDCNFFSTVANAVDINKRVVYGKAAGGRIVGRCLFALNDDGHILTFRRYSHDSEDGFSAAVDDFANQLATAMNTTQSSSGNVRRLVAREWYDDGARELAGRPDIDGAVREALAASPEADVYSLLQETMSAREVRERLEQLLKLPELRKRPDAVRTLLHGVSESGSWTLRERLAMARTAFDAGVTAVSQRLLREAPWKEVVGVLKADQCDYCNTFHSIGAYANTFEMLIDYHPSLALRAIRGSRVGRYKGDLQEENKHRRFALSAAHRKLGRIQLADALLKT